MMGMAEMYVVMMMSGMFWGAGMVGTMGLPPGEADAKLAQAAPQDAMLYVEWSARTSGKAGAKGIDGLAADPEVQQFLADVYKAIETGIAKETERAGPEERAAGKHVPPLVKILLNRPGCLAVGFDERAIKAGAGAPPVPGMRWLGLISAARATLVVNGGKDADKIAAHIQELVKLLPADMRKKGLQRQPLPIPGAPPGLGLTVHRHKDYFIVGFGKGTIDQAIAGLDGKSKGLTANAAFTDARKRVTFDRIANITWINGKSIIGKVTGLMGKGTADTIKNLGLGDLDVLVSATGVVNGEIRTRNYVGTGGKTEGVLALFSGRGIKKADLEHVPADSDMVLAFSVNAKGVLSAVRKIVAKEAPGAKTDLEKFIEGFEKELGLKLEDDLMAAFGDVWVLHDSKSAGGVFVTSLVASLDVRNEKKAKDVFTKLMDVLGEEILPGEIRGGFRPRGVYLKNKTFLGQRIYYINSVGSDVPFAPAFCLTKTHLLAAPHPQALKAHLRFLQSKDANFTSRLGKDFTLPEGDLLGMSYFESKRMVRALYGIAPYVGQMVMSQVQREGAEIDIFSLPSARAILPFIGNSYSTTVRTDKGIFTESQSAVPGASSGAIVGMLVPMMVVYGSAREMRRAPGRAIKDDRLKKEAPFEFQIFQLDRKRKSKRAAVLLRGLLLPAKPAAQRTSRIRPVSAAKPRRQTPKRTAT